VLDGGAYCGEGGFFAQMAAMHACGPYVIEHVDVDSMLVYTNNQPSGSIRAPTAPQCCWALEMHMDELAEELDLDPVELRRRTLIEEGDESPTRQVFGPVGIKETLERAAELIGYGQPLPANEGIGFACGWWPSFGVPSGAYVKLNADGTGTIVTGAQENGSGAVMGLPLLAAQALGMRPEDFSVLYQDTDAGPWDMGSSGSQTTFNNGRAVIEAAREVADKLRELAAEKLEIDPVDLELADGMVTVKGAPQKAVSIAELAGSGEAILGKGSGPVPEQPETSPDSGCLGRLGMESFLEPQLITHAMHVRVDPETGVVRVLRAVAAHESGVILNPIGARGQVLGGVVMGIGQALSEGMQLDADGRQLNPHLLDYKLVTSADAPPIEIAFVEKPAVDGGPNGSKGMGEPPCVPTAGAVGNAIAKATGRRVRNLPMTPERVWEATH
jgi:CO/xanthine dehydrogenase Mo-binding subunit